MLPTSSVDLLVLLVEVDGAGRAELLAGLAGALLEVDAVGRSMTGYFGTACGKGV